MATPACLHGRSVLTLARLGEKTRALSRSTRLAELIQSINPADALSQSIQVQPTRSVTSELRSVVLNARRRLTPRSLFLSAAKRASFTCRVGRAGIATSVQARGEWEHTNRRSRRESGYDSDPERGGRRNISRSRRTDGDFQRGDRRDFYRGDRRDFQRDDRGDGGEFQRGDRGDRREQQKQQFKPGDWICKECGFNCFGSKKECMRCGAMKPLEVQSLTGKDRFQECRVFVESLSYDTNWTDLKDHFKIVGPVAYASVSERPDGSRKGCGIVQFEREEDAQVAIEYLNGSELDGQTIRVREDRQFGRKREPHAGSASATRTLLRARMDGRESRTAPRQLARGDELEESSTYGDGDDGIDGDDDGKLEAMSVGPSDLELRPETPGYLARRKLQELGLVGRSTRMADWEETPDVRPGDWECQECGALVFASKATCYKCKAPRDFSSREGVVREPGGRRGWDAVPEARGMRQRRDRGYSSDDEWPGGHNVPVKPGDWECTECGAHVFARKLDCFRCGAPRAHNVKPPQERRLRRKKY